MTDARPAGSEPPRLTWADRFRGAMLGGAVGDALGAGVRDMSTGEIQGWFGPQGVTEFIPVFGRRGAVSDVTQLSVFTLDALLRAKAADPAGSAQPPTPHVLANYLRWLFTQGVPWEYAMSAYVRSEPEPTGWLLQRQELYSTRNPAGNAIALLGRMAMRSPYGPDGMLYPPTTNPGLIDTAAWAAPAMVWSESPQLVYSVAAGITTLFTTGVDAQHAAGMHSDVLAQLIRGVPLWDAAAEADGKRLGVAFPAAWMPADVRRTVHAAMFAGTRGRRPEPGQLDIEFDTAHKPGELGIALASVGCTSDFADAVRVAVNQSADSSVTGALAGQLAGALYGPEAIPSHWLEQLDLRDIIEQLCADASEAFAPPPVPRWAQRYVDERSPGYGGPLELTASMPAVDAEAAVETTMVLPPIGSDDVVPAADAADGAPGRFAAVVEEPVERRDAAPEPGLVGTAFAPEESRVGFAPDQEDWQADAAAAPWDLQAGAAFGDGPAYQEDGRAGAVFASDDRQPGETAGREGPQVGVVGGWEDPHSGVAAVREDFEPASVWQPPAVPESFAETPSGGDRHAEERTGFDPQPVTGPFRDWTRQDAGVAGAGVPTFPEPEPRIPEPGDHEPRSFLPPEPEPRTGAETAQASAGDFDEELADAVRAHGEDLHGFETPGTTSAPADGFGDEEDEDGAEESAADDQDGPAVDDEEPSLADEPLADEALADGTLADGTLADDARAAEPPIYDPDEGLPAQSASVGELTGVEDPADNWKSEARAGTFPAAIGAEASAPEVVESPVLAERRLAAVTTHTTYAASDVAEDEAEDTANDDLNDVEDETADSDAAPASVDEPTTAPADETHEPTTPEAAPAAHTEPATPVELVPAPAEPPVAAESGAAPAIASGGHAKPEAPEYVAPSLTERVLGSFLGGALGDSFGSDLEFISADEITARFGPQGPRGLRTAYGVRGAITDDTQMTLFTAEGLIRGSVAQRTLGADDPLPEVQLAYQRWLHTQGVAWKSAAGPFVAEHPAPDGWLVEVPGLFSTRGPGKTVFRALAGFGDGHPAGSFTEKINDSKGCGGVMRAAPVALYSASPAEVFELAARTAALTHSHPAGFHSAGALAVIVQQALLGRSLDDGVWLALQVLETWEDHDETTAMLKLAVELAERGVPTPQQLEEVLGGGWVGEEALGIAVCAALVGGDDVELALRVAAHHSGDSDSTAAICGNIVGALLGVGALPVDWLADLELRDVVEQIALDCVAEFGVGAFQPDADESARPADEDWSERYPVRPPRSARPATPSAAGEFPTRRMRAVSLDEPDQQRSQEPGPRRSQEPVAEFPAPKPAPRRINGVMPRATRLEGDDE
ncbi:ADP-ribosylglycohydrolase family protein [Saccharopolyspora erythraea]|uniref:ADP-ribosylglycohydrolase family protein n=1 Tax=Saccharopolyspora erythraea TaxID=1836 RepID=UPI002011C4A0|nr:ADP-ribosylglycohydrolase family protein [Saccharopolyspora erythraea]